jgi:hypothetical protein
MLIRLFYNDQQQVCFGTWGSQKKLADSKKYEKSNSFSHANQRGQPETISNWVME